MKRTEPSQKAKLQPPGWKLLAVALKLQSPLVVALLGHQRRGVDGGLDGLEVIRREDGDVGRVADQARAPPVRAVGVAEGLGEPAVGLVGDHDGVARAVADVGDLDDLALRAGDARRAADVHEEPLVLRDEVRRHAVAAGVVVEHAGAAGVAAVGHRDRAVVPAVAGVAGIAEADDLAVAGAPEGADGGAVGRAVLGQVDHQARVERVVDVALLVELRHRHELAEVLSDPAAARRRVAKLIGVAHREAAVDVVVVLHRQGELLEVVGALCPACGLAGRLHRRQQQGDQHADDGDDHEQLDQGEAATRGRRTLRYHRTFSLKYAEILHANAKGGRTGHRRSRLDRRMKRAAEPRSPPRSRHHCC